MTHEHGEHDDIDFGTRMEHIASALVRRGVITDEEITSEIAEQRATTPALGASMVARAWVDPDYKARLLADGKEAAAELGIDTSGVARLEILENTLTRHHVIVCTLCSCYPRPVLGSPPEWYKSFEYRGRVVREPRAVLEEFGLSLSEDVEVVVMDSTADRRFLVLPCRPESSEHLSVDELAALVTRDSMIGVGLSLRPTVHP